LIPGIGGQIAGLVAYDQSKKFSRFKSKFGTGHPEGLIAAESANNAMVGPSLVPLLTLSIPGSPTAAVLLGGLLIHGIFPGSDIFDRNPEVIWTFINSMLIGQHCDCEMGGENRACAAADHGVGGAGPIAVRFLFGAAIHGGCVDYVVAGPWDVFP
jgi:putative tricarboxylic transport membrane protein